MPAHKAIFLDRDNTLVEDPGYINHPDQVRLLNGVPEALRGFTRLNYKLVLVTNQSGVARGIVTEEVLKEIHQRLQRLLGEKGVSLDRIYYCPYHVDGAIAKYRKASEDRKPNPGMLLKAARDMDIDLQQSWCIGNRLSDVEAGQRAGCRTILIDAFSPTGKVEPGRVKPNFVAVNMREALNIVKQAKDAHVAITVARQVEVEQPASSPKPKQVSAPSVLRPHVLPSEERTVDRPEEKKETIPSPSSDSTSETLLRAILDQLKSLQRDDMFDEFSLLRFMAGISQIAVVLCLLIAIWLLMSSERSYNPIFTALGFAAVLQMLSLTLTLHGRK